jgi:hypothetical protein
MTTLERAAGAVIGVAALAVVVICANAPITVHGSDQAILRLAWSVRPERVEHCRQQSEEELERLPAHMRQPVICEGTSAQYRLTVLHDGVVAAEQLVHGGGLRQDRRIYVFQELPLDPGEGTIEVRFDRIDPDAPNMAAPATDDDRKTGHDPDDRRVERKDRQEAGETVPPHLILTQRLQIRPREVVLVTYSQERQALAVIRASVTN